MRPRADDAGATMLATPPITTLRREDVAEGCRLLRSEPAVCFEDWETPLVAKQAADAPDLVPAYYRDGQLLGLAVAGTFGVRGTISHVVTSPRARGLGIASHLVDSALAAMTARGVRRVFLFTTPGNEVAESFWRSAGFRETSAEKTFEIDC